MGYSLLFYRNSRGQPRYVINIRLVEDPKELAGVSGKGLDVASLPFGEDRVEGQRGFSGTRRPGEDDKLILGKSDGNVF